LIQVSPSDRPDERDSATKPWQDQARPETGSRPREAGPRHGMKVLLVEDDVRLARALKRALEEEMHTVEVVTDGTTALELGTEPSLDVLILDVMLPGIDGFEVCRRLREAGVSTPILILTARGDVSDRVQGLDAGADDYLAKPFALVELLARLRALGRRTRGAAAGERIQVGDLVLDPSTHSATRAGKEINLTVKEYVLLDLLMRHKGLVLTRSQILDHVWELDNDLSSNVLETYIHYLRSKIDKGFEKPLIQTVRGVGYRLRA
jgi:DNA-binding response OmpR family regulator